MITIRTRPINTYPARTSTGLSGISSMRAALNSGYCMRAQILSRRLGNGQVNGETKEEFFSYQEGQHHVVSNKLLRTDARSIRRLAPSASLISSASSTDLHPWSSRCENKQKKKSNGNGKLHLPEQVKIIKTKNGKRWSTASMEVEKAGDILEIRDGLGKIVDALLLKSKV